MCPERDLPSRKSAGNYITPIYKKHGKPIHDPNPYRRITITSVIGKILEKYILQTAFAKIESGQNPLQKGFTKGTSATTAALMFTEALAEARDTKQPCTLHVLMHQRPLMSSGTILCYVNSITWAFHRPVGIF